MAVPQLMIKDVTVYKTTILEIAALNEDGAPGNEIYTVTHNGDADNIFVQTYEVKDEDGEEIEESEIKNALIERMNHYLNHDRI